MPKTILLLLALGLCGLLATLARAEPATATDASESAPPTTAPADAEVDDDWVHQQFVAEGLRDLAQRNEVERLRQPYQRRAPSWIQNATELHAGRASAQADETARAERDRQTVAWLIDDEARRQAASAAAGVPTGLPAEPASFWRRGLAVVLLFTVLVGAGVVVMVRRPWRSQPTTPSSADAAPQAARPRHRHRSRRDATV